MSVPKINRDTLLLISGILGMFYETLFERIDRPYLLGVFAGMMGLPVFLRRDESAKEKDVDPDPVKGP